MALQVTIPIRKFVFDDDNKEIDLPDPNPSMTIREVQKFYAQQYPSIITGSIVGPEIKMDKESKVDIATYKITSNPGTHG
jgi:PRTRC genetic system protein C